MPGISSAKFSSARPNAAIRRGAQSFSICFSIFPGPSASSNAVAVSSGAPVAQSTNFCVSVSRRSGRLSANSSIHLTNRSVHFSRRPGSDSANPSAQPANLVPNSLIFPLTLPHSPPAHWRTVSLHIASFPGSAFAWETIHLPNLVANSMSFRRTSPHSPPAHLTNSAVHSGRFFSISSGTSSVIHVEKSSSHSPSFAANLRPISNTQSTNAGIHSFVALSQMTGATPTSHSPIARGSSQNQVFNEVHSSFNPAFATSTIVSHTAARTSFAPSQARSQSPSNRPAMTSTQPLNA